MHSGGSRSDKWKEGRMVQIEKGRIGCNVRKWEEDRGNIRRMRMNVNS